MSEILSCGVPLWINLFCLLRLFDMALEDPIRPGDCRFSLTESAKSFNGEPQAQAKHGNDACGLPLND